MPADKIESNYTCPRCLRSAVKAVVEARDNKEAWPFLIACPFCKNPIALIDSKGRIHQRKQV